MSEPVVYNEQNVSADSLQIEGMSLEDIQNLPPSKALLMHPGGRVEIIDKDVIARQRQDAKPYHTNHPRHISLDSVMGDEEAATIAFHHRLIYPIDFEKLKSTGRWDGMEEWCATLYHGHVLWSYAMSIAREEDGRYSFTVVNVGSHLPFEGPTASLPGFAHPPLKGLMLMLIHKDCQTVDDLEIACCNEDLSISFTDRYTEKQLRDLAVDGNINVSLMFMAPRDYFSLASIIDLDAKPTVPAGAKEVVDTILRGEKPADGDWEITGSQYTSDEDVYSVHKSTFANFSSHIETAPDAAEIGLLTGLDDYGVRMAIRIAYGVDVPLPEGGKADTKALIDGLHALFGDHITTVVAPQWERAICAKALALEKSEPLSSPMVQLLHLLNIVWSMPAGCVPVARRIALGTLADMAHLNADSSLQQWVHDSVMPCLEESGFHGPHISPVLEAFYKMMNILPGAEKFALKAGGGLVDPSVLEGEEEEGEENVEEQQEEQH